MDVLSQHQDPIRIPLDMKAISASRSQQDNCNVCLYGTVLKYIYIYALLLSIYMLGYDIVYCIVLYHLMIYIYIHTYIYIYIYIFLCLIYSIHPDSNGIRCTPVPSQASHEVRDGRLQGVASELVKTILWSAIRSCLWYFSFPTTVHQVKFHGMKWVAISYINTVFRLSRTVVKDNLPP